MSNQSVKPRGLVDLKILAKAYKRAHDVSHGQALEAIARLAGYASFKEAKAALELMDRTQS